MQDEEKQQLNSGVSSSDGAETVEGESKTEHTELTDAAENAEVETAEAAEVQTEDEDMQTVQPPKKGKFRWLGPVFLVAVIALGIFLMFTIVANMGDEVKSFDEVISASDWRFALVSLAALLTVLASIWLEYLVVMKATTGKCYVGTSLKVAFVGKFYDNITPFATGGQPMQIYCLNKKGIKGGVSTAIILIRYFAWMFCWLILSMLFMACATGVLEGQEHSSKMILLIGGWIGLVVNMFIPVILILFVVVPGFSRAVTSFVIKIGHKIKIVKSKESAMEKVEKTVNDFRSSFKLMSRRPVHFIILIALCFVEIFLWYAFPYFIMKMFSGLTDADGFSVMLSVMALNIYATMSASVVPTPGNSGAIEGLVTAAFSAVAGNVLLWTVFGWRFGMYYIYILIGIGITIAQFIQSIIRRKRSGK